MSLWSWLCVLVLTFVVARVSWRSPERSEAAGLSRVQLYGSTSLGLWALAAVGLALFAAFLAALVFGLAHAYQGWLGGVRAAMIALLLSAPVLVSGSLLPAIAAHALIDAAGILWLWPVLERRCPLTAARPGSY